MGSLGKDPSEKNVGVDNNSEVGRQGVQLKNVLKWARRLVYRDK